MERNNSYDIYYTLAQFIKKLLDANKELDRNEIEELETMSRNLDVALFEERQRSTCALVNKIMEDHLDVMSFVVTVLDRVKKYNSIEEMPQKEFKNLDDVRESAGILMFDACGKLYEEYQYGLMSNSNNNPDNASYSEQARGSQIPVTNHNNSYSSYSSNPHNRPGYGAYNRNPVYQGTYEQNNQKNEPEERKPQKGLFPKKGKKRENDELDEQLRQKQQKVDDLERTIKELEEKKKRCESDFNNTCDEWSKKLKNLKDDYETIKNEIGEAKDELENLRSKCLNETKEAREEAAKIKNEADKYKEEKRREADSYKENVKAEISEYLQKKSELPKLDASMAEAAENEARESRKRLLGISDSIASLQGNINENYKSVIDRLSEELSKVRQDMNTDLENWRSDLFRRDLTNIGMLYISMYAVYNHVVLEKRNEVVQMENTDDVPELVNRMKIMKEHICDITNQFRAICEQYEKALGSVGISVILPSEGDEFDPVRHVNSSGGMNPRWIRKVITPGISMVMSSKNEDKIIMQAQVEAD